MAKRRGRDQSAPGDSPAPEAPIVAGQPQIEMRMRGNANDVKAQLGVAVEAQPVVEKLEDNGHNDEKEKFVTAIRNPRYVVKVKRRAPRELAGHCWDSECPMTYAEIQEETKANDGGGSFRASVVDPESNKTIAADTFEIPGDPIVAANELMQQEQDRLLMRGAQKDPGQLAAEGLSRRAEVTAKMIEVEALEQQLREQRTRGKAGEQPAGRGDTRIDDLERRLMEAKHQAELEARDRKHQEEMKELRALITQNARPAKETDSMTILLEQMRADRKASDDRFNVMMKQMQDDKMTALLDEVKSIKNKPQTQGTSLLEQAEAMLKMKKIFGWGGEDDDDDDEDDVDDKRPWWERALDKLGGKFGDKLLAKFTDMEEKGEVIVREKFMAEMSQYADQVAADAAARQTSRLPAQAKPPGLPAPPATAPVQQLPPPPPAGGAPAAQLPPPPPPTAPVQQNPQLTVEQEITIRVGTVLDMLDREATFRANEYHWNYEGCWMALPDDLLEKVCAATDGATFVDALTTPLLTPEKIAELKTKLTANPKTAAWFMVGLNELKEWHLAKQSDPTFDPFADDEEEGAAE